MKFAIAAAILLATACGAYAMGLGKLGFQFGREGAVVNKKGGASPPLANLRITNTGDFRITNLSDNRAVSP